MKYLAICPKCETIKEICEDKFRPDWYCYHHKPRIVWPFDLATEYVEPEKIRCKIVVVPT